MSRERTGTVLVTGATGDIGRKLIQALSDAGEPVRALCRRRQQVSDFQDRGIDAALGDLGDRASLEAAMRGADRLFLLTLPARTQHEHGRNAVRAAVAAGVHTVVHLSTADANPQSAIPWASAPALTDELIKSSGIAWTLLKPTAFMQNLLQSAAPIRRGVLPQTSGDGVAGWIDTHDIAAVAARVLTEGGHDGREHVLTGPELFSMRDIAEQLSAAAGHRVRYLHLPSPAFYALLRATGVDAFTARGLRHQFADALRHGRDGADVLTDTVAAITGTAPRTFLQFAEANRQAFS